MTTLTQTQTTVIKAAASRPNGSIYPMPTNLKGNALKKVIESLQSKNMIDEHGTITTLGLDIATPEWNAKPQSIDDIGTQPENAWMPGFIETEEAAFEALAEASEPLAEASEQVVTIEVQEALDRPANIEEADPELMAIAKRHFSTITPENWPAIRDTIEDAYTLGYQQAKARKARTNQDHTPRTDTKKAKVIELIMRPNGATIAEIVEATGWTNNTIRGFISIAKKNLGLHITSRRNNNIGETIRVTTYYA
ncbi:MAG: DUF3489 domain-containing protein [Magnetococcales bacterium]|nr:DUF3489 domain-containing protein [Magnetococcales bacterium]